MIFYFLIWAVGGKALPLPLVVVGVAVRSGLPFFALVLLTGCKGMGNLLPLKANSVVFYPHIKQLTI